MRNRKMAIQSQTLMMMKVLLLTQILPYPPNSGPRIKTFHVIRYLSRFCQITLVSFVRKEEIPYIDHLKMFCRKVHTVPIQRGIVKDLVYMANSLITGKPFLICRDFRLQMVRLLNRMNTEESFDVVLSDQLNMAPYALRVAAPLKILDTHNALWLLYQRLSRSLKPGPKKWLFSREWQRLKTYEGDICRRFNSLLAVSQNDKLALEKAMGCSHPIHVVPIGIDTDSISIIDPPGNSYRILHIGTMYWPPNAEGVEWFIRHVLPFVQARQPRATLEVIGSNPPRHIRRLGKANHSVNVHGYVEDPTPYLARTAVVVVPLQAASGMRVKILEALARGLPVVSTRIGCEGLEVKNKRHLLIADRPRRFGAAVLSVLGDRELARSLGRNGRHLVEEIYDYRKTCRPLKKIFKEESKWPS